MSTILLDDAVHTLRMGGTVAFPTETVYGLGADARNDRAVAEIYALKNRPSFNPLIIHFADAADAMREVQWNARAQALAEAFWPGPLTLVLPRAENSRISLLAGAGLKTLAVRVPSHPLALALLRAAQLPLAAPSANHSGRISPTAPEHVRQEFGGAVSVLDGGRCAVGVESTVLDISGERPVLLRPGAVTAEAMGRILNGEISYPEAHAAITAPGMLASHYAPSLPVRLNAGEAQNGEALLGFGPAPSATLNLSQIGDLTEAAANLFAHLRVLDRPEFAAIAVMPIPEEGLGAAINDRLRRAAAR